MFASQFPLNSRIPRCARGPDGNKIAFSCAAVDLVATDTNRAFDVYVRDLVAETTKLVSANADGTDSGNRGSGGVWWDETGTRIVFAGSPRASGRMGAVRRGAFDRAAEPAL